LKKVLVLLTFLTLNLHLTAAEKLTTYQIQEIEVKDDRAGVAITDLGKQVEIVTAEQIEKMPVNSVDELLRFIPGVEIQSRGAFGTQADMSIRGGTYNQTLILLDGVRIGDPMTRHFNSNLPISLAAIKRIEVIKGGGSALYGADAVGGVINIVTKGMSLNEDYEEVTAHGTRGQASVGIGDFSTKMGSVYYGMAITDKFYLETDIAHASSYGYEALDGTHNYDFNNSLGSALGYYGYGGNGSYVVMRVGGEVRDFDARYFYTLSPADKSDEKVERLFVQVKNETYIGGSDKIVFNGIAKQTRDDFLFNPAFPGNVHTTLSSDFSSYYQSEVQSWLNATIGFDSQYLQIESNDRGNRVQNRYGIFAVFVASLLPDFTANIGARLQTLPNTDTEYVPTIGLKYDLSDAIGLRANAGKSIRTPDFTENYVSTGLPGILSENRNLGNPNLLPEVAWDYELGTDIMIADNYKFELTGYMRDAKNLIDYGLTKGSEIENNTNLDPQFIYLYAQNLGELTVKGVEFKLSNSAFMSSQALNWYVGGNVLEYDLADEVNSKYLANAAGLNLAAGISYNITTGLSATLDGNYRSRNISDEQQDEFKLSKRYFVADMMLAYQWKDFRFKLTAKNLLDEQYSDILGVDLPGRWLMFQIDILNLGNL